MKINSRNFLKSVPLLSRCIINSHFVAIDFEYSGILRSPFVDNSFNDFEELRYWKNIQKIDNYSPIQMGISGFQFLPKSNIVNVFPFNIYLFPKFHHKNQDLRFNLETTQFLFETKFDFNTFFYQSIPFDPYMD